MNPKILTLRLPVGRTRRIAQNWESEGIFTLAPKEVQCILGLVPYAGRAQKRASDDLVNYFRATNIGWVKFGLLRDRSTEWPSRPPRSEPGLQ
jgi:hypothetical protein